MKKTRTTLILGMGFLIALLLLLFASGPTWAQGAGKIEGRVTNGSQNGAPVKGITVTLHIFEDTKEKQTLETTTDGEGFFAFEGINTGENLRYVATVKFQGLIYNSSVSAFTAGQNVLSLPIEVYETTKSDEDIVVERAHFIIDIKENSLLISEMFFFNNRGTRTFTGSELPSGELATLRFALPQGAENVSFPSGAILQGDELFYSFPVMPGPMSQPIIIEYSFPFSGSEVRLSHKVFYPVERYNILVVDAGIDVKSPRVEFRGRVGQGEAQYLNYEGNNLEKGSELVIELSGLRKVGRPSGFGKSWWSIALVTLLLLALFVAYPLLRRRARLAPVSSLEEQLLQELAELDDAFEQGLIDEETYRHRREEKKKHLLQLLRKTERR